MYDAHRVGRGVGEPFDQSPLDPERRERCTSVLRLSGPATIRDRRRSKCQRSKASAVLGGNGSSGFAAVRRDLKPIRPEHPVGDDDPGCDPIAIARGASAIDTSGMDHDEPSRSARGTRVKQTGIDRGICHRRCGPAAHFIDNAAIGAASGHGRVAPRFGRTQRTGRYR
jgi:hypothetical protein